MIITGDLNAKHGSWNILNDNQALQSLNKYIKSRIDTIASTNTPTIYPKDIRHLIYSL